MHDLHPTYAYQVKPGGILVYPYTQEGVSASGKYANGEPRQSPVWGTRSHYVLSWGKSIEPSTRKSIVSGMVIADLISMAFRRR